MRIKYGFVQRDVMDEYIVMLAGAQMKEFEGVVVLNEPSAFLWKKMQSDVTRQELVEALLEEYDIDSAVAEKDTEELLKKLDMYGVLEGMK